MRFSPRYFPHLWIAIFSICTAVHAGAAEVNVITNNNTNISSISSDDLKDIFLLTKKSFADGTHAEPVLSKGGAAHEAFLKHYLGKSDDSLVTYYRNVVFTGKGLTPRSFRSDAEVSAYVAKTKGAIGYVSSETKMSGVKAIDVK
jgi:ABC-type phosphate transport system substrate-binding protein